MHQRTLSLLEELQKAHWFSRVGMRDTLDAIVLVSWHDALLFRALPEWEDLRLEMANQYRERLDERSRERFAKWNEIVGSLNKTLVPFVRGKIEPVVREHSLPNAFASTVEWDILHACMETEYADVYPPGFYANLASWYVKGHFPCGWQGVFPQGMLIIY
jgi:hypothetical protein